MYRSKRGRGLFYALFYIPFFAFYIPFSPPPIFSTSNLSPRMRNETRRAACLPDQPTKPSPQKFCISISSLKRRRRRRRRIMLIAVLTPLGARDPQRHIRTERTAIPLHKHEIDRSLLFSYSLVTFKIYS